MMQEIHECLAGGNSHLAKARHAPPEISASPSALLNSLRKEISETFCCDGREAALIELVRVSATLAPLVADGKLSPDAWHCLRELSTNLVLGERAALEAINSGYRIYHAYRRDLKDDRACHAAQ